MSIKDAKALTDGIFQEIQNAKSIHDLKKILENNEEIKINRMDVNKYPKIKFEIEYDEIKDFESKINDNSKIEDPLSKLLYALAWKNGDLVKIKHIVEGIKDAGTNSDAKIDGLVFYQFGKYLTKKDNEPIIDQHVIRAFKVFKCNETDIVRCRKIELLSKKNIEDISDYKSWLISNELQQALKNEKDYVYYIDQILFALGKTIKLKNKNPK